MAQRDNKPPREPIPEKAKRRLLQAARRELDPFTVRHRMGETILLVLEVVMVSAQFLFFIVWFAFGIGFGFGSRGRAVIIAIAVIVGFMFLLRISYRARHRYQTRAARAKYCADGELPICVNCEYDLRGRSTKQCPECGEPVFRFSK